MRVLCRHGHFAFFPKRANDIAKFCNYYGVELERDGDFYTFPALVGAPRFSLKGKSFLNMTALANYEGRGPLEVFRENGFVFDIEAEEIVLASSIDIQTNPKWTGNFILAEAPLLQPGSRNAAGQRILSYDAEFFQEFFQLRISEISYV